MRIATYNVEWFDRLFDDDGALLNDTGWSGRYDVTRAEQIAALVTVFQAVDADAVMIIEAPDVGRGRSGVTALANFAEFAGLRAREVVMGFANDTQQEIMLLYDPASLTPRHDPKDTSGTVNGAARAPRFDGVFLHDLGVDARQESIRWSKPPLEIAATSASGRKFRMIGVHAKSKAPNGAQDEAEIMRVAIENRRKQLAQCTWLRRRVLQHLEAGEDLLVMGDFNDGPGLDEYENLFGQSSVEIVLGAESEVRLFDPHAKMAISRKIGAAPTTSRFRISPDGQFLSALLDYIMVSPNLADQEPDWLIWHPFENPDCYDRPDLREALLTASDHFPVSIDIDL